MSITNLPLWTPRRSLADLRQVLEGPMRAASMPLRLTRRSLGKPAKIRGRR